MIGTSLQITTIRNYLAQVARFNTHVLITGETGTGKELAAEMLHATSLRSKCPFSTFNCAAIPDSLVENELFGHDKGAFTGAESKREGLFASAQGGTVFLDEIGEMPLSGQAKILRVLETRQIQRLGSPRSYPVDVRIVAATNQNLEERVAQGLFRRDLYYRLNVAKVHIPPLRKRKEDIPALIEYFVHIFNEQIGRQVIGLEPEVNDCLMEYDWPGNVRELKNVLEATFLTIQSSRIRFDDLPTEYQVTLAHKLDRPRIEREKLLTALLATNWNKTNAAKQLHWPRMTVYRKMVQYSIGQPMVETKV